VDRTRSWALGLRGGSYLSGYDNGAGYGDAGIGLALRYRPVEAIGFELQWEHHDQTFNAASERMQSPLSASVELFGMPWSRFNPYALAGVTINNRNIQDEIGPFTTVDTAQTIWGPHGGLGVELGVGERASVNFDLRGIGYLNVPPGDPSTPGAVQANMGVNFYF
jgi:opacity protein-like surface antigen